MGGSRGGGDKGSGPPWKCQIINFCHVEIFRQNPSGNLDPPPPENVLFLELRMLLDLDCTIRVAKTKAQISLLWSFVFAYMQNVGFLMTRLIYHLVHE